MKHIRVKTKWKPDDLSEPNPSPELVLARRLQEFGDFHWTWDWGGPRPWGTEGTDLSGVELRVQGRGPLEVLENLEAELQRRGVVTA